MGPVATRLVRHHSNSTRNFDELVDLLAGEIPDEQDSRKFREFCLRER